MSIIDQTIQNLELISRTLDKASFCVGNDDWCTYLEHASMNLYREAQWLKEKKEFVRGFFDEDDRRCK